MPRLMDSAEWIPRIHGNKKIDTTKKNAWLRCLMMCAAAAIWVPLSDSVAADQPNIIYVMTDDLGYGDLGCYGQEVVRTPNLDRMAAEGIRFTDHYAGHTVCRPSRLVLWTGQHVGHTGLIGNRPRSLTGMEQTVAKRLQQVGYSTAGVGKWALGNVDDPSEVGNDGHPNNNGFDYWMGYLSQSNAHNYYPTFLWENATQVPLPGNVIGDYPNGRGRVASKRVTYSHDVMTERAFQFIRDHRSGPFLLHIHWTIPHANNEGGRVTGDGMEVPDLGPYADRDWPAPEKGFAAMVSWMDRDMGRLMKLLKELEIDDHTVVFFTSDNGPHNEGGHQHTFFDSNGPLQGFKRSMHEGGIRVPMLVRWPGKIKAGSVTDHPSAFWDFLPTACELAGAPLPEHTVREHADVAGDSVAGDSVAGDSVFKRDRDSKRDGDSKVGGDRGGVDGISYLPTLLGMPEKQQEHEYLYWASQEGQTSVGMRAGNWKLVQYRAKRGRRGSAGGDAQDWRLYDLNTDLGEQRDLASKHPDVVERLLDLLRRDDLL